MNVGTALVSNGEAPELGEPRKGPLHLRPMPPEPFAAVDAASCDARDDATGAALTAASEAIATFAGVELVLPAAGTTAGPAHRRHGTKGGGQHVAVVPVRPAERQAKRRALAIDEQMPLRPRLASACRMGAGLRAPLLRRTGALSSDALLRLRQSAPRNRSRSPRCSAAQSPASMPLHQPSPTRLAAAAHLGWHILPLDPGAQHSQDAGQRHLIQPPGLPPFGFGASGGNSSEIAVHRSSGP